MEIEIDTQIVSDKPLTKDEEASSEHDKSHHNRQSAFEMSVLSKKFCRSPCGEVSNVMRDELLALAFEAKGCWRGFQLPPLKPRQPLLTVLRRYPDE